MKTLYLEKRGCNFWDDETVESDILKVVNRISTEQYDNIVIK